VTTDGTTLAHGFREGAQFSVRIFEGIVGIFQDAHFRRTVRTFE